ncbi:MAG: 4Fe-4S binding protein [Candidatus Bathyarchaeota archaeon]|jgi:2-oxoglutarate ferredoxin oxidoreductase subunit delta
MPLRIWREPLDVDKTKIPHAEIRIIKERCRGCGFCIEFCPKDVLEVSDELNKKGAYPPRVVDETRCALCNFCQTICPDAAIFTIRKEL